MERIAFRTDFRNDVRIGLTAEQKFLSSKYFYDDKGSRIFQNIMQMPEYYLTDCELEIFETQKHEIFEVFANGDAKFDLIELGAGDGLKTKVLLSHFHDQNALFEYIPIDISEEAVKNLVLEVERKLPGIKIVGKVGDYFKLMEEINQYDNAKKILLFLGSNIGNFNKQETLDFLNNLKSVMHPKDMLCIGFDLKKDSNIILKAYNDPHGYTSAFNLNLLQRINNELNANFNLHFFKHHEVYDSQTGTAKSYLISMQNQVVEISDLKLNISFKEGESIFMEMSQKYDLKTIKELADISGFEIVRNFYDERQYFVNSIWKLKN